VIIATYQSYAATPARGAAVPATTGGVLFGAFGFSWYVRLLACSPGRAATSTLEDRPFRFAAAPYSRTRAGRRAWCSAVIGPAELTAKPLSSGFYGSYQKNLQT